MNYTLWHGNQVIELEPGLGGAYSATRHLGTLARASLFLTAARGEQVPNRHLEEWELIETDLLAIASEGTTREPTRAECLGLGDVQ